MPEFDRNHADRFLHHGISDCQDPVRKLFDRSHRATAPFHETLRSCHVEFERATKQARFRNPSEYEIRVRASGIFAPAIANWAGTGSGALRADSERSCAIE